MASSKDIVEGFKSVLKTSKDAPVLMEARDSRLFIGSYSDYHGILYECKTELKDFKAVFSNSIAKEIPKFVVGDNIKLELVDDNRVVKLSTSSSKVKLSLLEDKALTMAKLLNKYEKVFVWEVDGADFRESLEQVRHSANDKSIGDIVLRGFHLTKTGNRIEFMASNGASMSVSKFPVANLGMEVDKQLLLNSEFHQISQLLEGKTKISFNDDAISVESHIDDDRVIRAVSLLTKGKAFDYNKVLKLVAENESYVKLEAKQLFETLRRINFFTDDSQKNKVSLNIKPEEVTLYSANHYGESSVKLEVVETNFDDEITLELSGVNLLSYLSNVKSDSISLFWKDDSSPIRLEDGIRVEVIVLFRK